jgi:hypothetical protein
VLSQPVGCALTPGSAGCTAAADEAAAGALMSLAAALDSPGAFEMSLELPRAAARPPQPPQRGRARKRKADAAFPAAVDEAGSRKRPVRRSAAAAAVAIRLSSNLPDDPLQELQQNLQDSAVLPSTNSKQASEMEQETQQEGPQATGNEKPPTTVVTQPGEQVTGSDQCQAGMLVHARALRHWQLVCMGVQQLFCLRMLRNDC